MLTRGFSMVRPRSNVADRTMPLVKLPQVNVVPAATGGITL